jgi:5'-nucleotidase
LPFALKTGAQFEPFTHFSVHTPSAFSHFDEDTLKRYEHNRDEIPGIFSLMIPMPGAIDAFKELSHIFDTYILSTSPWENPSAWSDKLLWVKQHIGETAHKRLILSHHKNLNSGDYLVDDRTKNGADRFQGELILFGSDEFKNWEVVVEYLQAKSAN